MGEEVERAGGGGSGGVIVTTDATTATAAGSSSSSSSSSRTNLGVTGSNTWFLDDERIPPFKRLNLLEGNHVCGANKCLFPLKASSSLGETTATSTNVDTTTGAFSSSRPRRRSVGYLATANRKVGNLMIKVDESLLRKAIYEKYHLLDVQRGPTRCQPETKEMRTWMDSNLTESGHEGKDVGGDDDSNGHHHLQTHQKSSRSSPRFLEGNKGGIVCHQLVEILEEDDVLVFAGENVKRMVSWNRVDGWLETIFRQNRNNKHDVGVGAEDDDGVLSIFLQDVQNLQKLLEEFPCLWNDFQIFVHKSGRIFQFDLDRCYHRYKSTPIPPPVILVSRYRGYFLSLVEYITQSLRQHRLPPPTSSSLALAVPPKNVATQQTTIINGPANWLQKTWEFAEETIHQHHQMDHGYLGSPQQQQEVVSSSNAISWSANATLHRNVYESVLAYDNCSSESSQPSMETLERHFIFKALQYDRRGDNNNNNHASLLVLKRMRILQRFEISFGRLIGLLEKHPVLYHNFQIEFHSNGEIFHKTLERCFDPTTLLERKPPARKEKGLCNQNIVSLGQRIASLLRMGKRAE